MNSLAKTVTWILGVVLLATGIYGFFENPVFTIFQVNNIHNGVHILSGVIGLLAAFSGSQKNCRLFLIVFGLVYAVVTIAGFMNVSQVVSLLMLNPADNYLHLAITVVTLGTGLLAKK